MIGIYFVKTFTAQYMWLALVLFRITWNDWWLVIAKLRGAMSMNDVFLPPWLFLRNKTAL